MKRKDITLFSLYASSYACVCLSDLLPCTDICDELDEILLKQCTILSELIENKQIDLQEIKEFMQICIETIKRVENLNAVQE